jgi:hypothetical protein
MLLFDNAEGKRKGKERGNEKEEKSKSKDRGGFIEVGECRRE